MVLYAAPEVRLMASRLELDRIVAQSVHEGDTIEATLAWLRNLGASEIESIPALCDGRNVSAG